MRPNNFNDLLELQKTLDKAVSEERENRFIPRERTEFDIRMALDDEFNEFMKELPQELNFKTWKEIKHDPEKQLEEFVDCLFFMLAAANDFHGELNEYEFKRLEESFENFEKLTIIDIFTHNEIIVIIKEKLEEFKINLQNCDLSFIPDFKDIFDEYLSLGRWLGYDKEIILETYYKKWKKNMKRIKGDWSL